MAELSTDPQAPISPLALEQPDGTIFPWADVTASRAARSARRGVRAAQARYAQGAVACPVCGTLPTNQAWFYFASPAWTWDHLCGRAGWMTVCDPCHRQVNFFLEALN